MNIKRTITSLFLFVIAGTTSVPAQQFPFSLPVPTPGVNSYDAAIPTHRDVLGYEIGERHTRPDEIVTYYTRVGEASDRVAIGWHGSTYEGRPLVHAFISSPANLARLEEIRTANLRLSDDAAAVTDVELENMPAIVYAGYSVHGNEASGSEAAMLLLYYLAAGQGPAIDEVLNNTVVILDPSFNPDGRDRFVDWVNRNRGRVATSDRFDREHNEPWPGGRTNHYFFDLNRDWLPVQLPESRGRMELFHEWRPQLLTDHHEMGGNATFFFQPGIPSRGNPNTPQRTFDLTSAIADYHAQYLDRIGSLYYTEESFDDFYYGKGSTFPDVNGAVGILFEQASSRALLADVNDGPLSYAYTVRNHFTASLSTLKAAVELRQRLLGNQRDFYRESADVARALPFRAWVFGSPRYPTRTRAMLDVMLSHRIQVFELAQATEGFSPGSAYIVPVDQPQVRLAKTMMERVTEFTDSLFYDVSTWTFPLAFGVPDGTINRDLDRYRGRQVTDLPRSAGSVIGSSELAYAFEWGRYYSGRALYRLQEAGIVPRLMTGPFTASVNGSTRQFPAGTVVLPVVRRDGSGMPPAELRNLLTRIASEDDISFFAIDGGRTPSGSDLGSGSARVLEEPRVAIISGNGTSGYRVGEMWHLLNERMGMPVSLIDTDRFGSADLSAYNTIILTGFFRGLSDGDVSELKDWIRRGGTLIATGTSVPWVLRQEIVRDSLKDVPEVGDGNTPYAERSDLTGAQFLGGSAFAATLDPTHPLAFGQPETVYVFKTNRNFLELSDRAGVNVARLGEGARASGYISDPVNGLVANSASIMATRSGRGHVVLYTEDPNFRAFWYGSAALFMNAVFFGGSY